ncbi:cation efflux protein [Cylindrobasidium torrendii FP15055 ss-10]|uniref:Cation efflux protein n=1 Tax=Cylindrobasidium torrendii FP15055 ss-10 TaxID=1314674 RepID=A0A0D7BNA4_9AGAR|nr:cation efflux protein [Cylindrobasidium torrendii FP15055 ss-10]
MALSRSARITILLIIDVAFFFVELIAGYAVGSLALVADSFHMLNDVLSLIVGLYAIKLSAQTDIDSRYSYGWHRAEILAALVNGVFLLALCFSISLEAIERFFSVPQISNAKLVVIVGSLGLASNFVGLLLFHEHGHSHSHGSHGEEAHSHGESAAALSDGQRTPTQKITINRSRSRSPSPVASYSYGHPAATRASMVQKAQEMAARSPSPHRQSVSRHRNSLDGEAVRTPQSGSAQVEEGSVTLNLAPDHDHDEQSPLLEHAHDIPSIANGHSHGHGGHGHSHGSMNMQALILHVIGDALGNVGVIAAGLVIWLTEWRYKYYFDPAISLIITIIIFSSALPLVRSTAFILLQAVPPTVSLDSVRDAILDVDGVISLHELHVWQLSETKIIASVHVLTSREHDFMPVAATIRRTLHQHGIHSSTIQPEYSKPLYSNEVIKPPVSDCPCLIMCPPDKQCSVHENACCAPPTADV